MSYTAHIQVRSVKYDCEFYCTHLNLIHPYWCVLEGFFYLFLTIINHLSVLARFAKLWLCKPILHQSPEYVLEFIHSSLTHLSISWSFITRLSPGRLRISAGSSSSMNRSPYSLFSSTSRIRSSRIFVSLSRASRFPCCSSSFRLVSLMFLLRDFLHRM